MLAGSRLNRKFPEVDVNAAGLVVVSFMKAPAPEFENTLTWADLVRQDRSQPRRYLFTRGRCLVRKRRSFMRSNRLIRSHQKYYVYKSSKTLLNLKLCRENECGWSLRAAKRKGCDLWEIKKYKGPHSCVNTWMSTDHQ